MSKYIKTYLDSGFVLMQIEEDDIYVFKKEDNIHLSAYLKPSDAENKEYVGINSLKKTTNAFKNTIEKYKDMNIVCDYVLGALITESSRLKFYEHKKEILSEQKVNFCGMKKLKERLVE